MRSLRLRPNRLTYKYGVRANPEEVDTVNLVFMQLPMVVFTTLAPMASGAFIGLAIAFLTARFSQEQLLRIDRWTLLPLAVLAAGYLASFVFYASPEHAFAAFQGIGLGSMSFAAVAGMLFATLAVVYWIIAMTGELPYQARKVFAVVVGAASLLLSLAIGVSYMGSGVITWSSPLVPLGLMGFAAAGGVPLGALVISLGGGLRSTRRTRFSDASVIVAFIGVAAAFVSVTSQLLFAQSVYSAYYTGVEALPNSWAYLVVAIVGFVAMLACLRSALAPEGRSAVPVGRTAGAAAAVPQRDLTGDTRVGIRSATSVLVIGNVCVIAAIFVARMMFYALQF